MKPEPAIEIAFQEFVETHLGRLNSFAFRLARPDNELARDLVQDTIVKAFSHLRSGKLAPERLSIQWMLTVLRNEFLMHLRAQKLRSGPSLSEFATFEHLAPDTTSVREIERKQLREVLSTAIAELSEEHRQVVTLIDVRGMDYNQAAVILDIPVGTVRSRLSRARLRLAGRLTELGVQP